MALRRSRCQVFPDLTGRRRWHRKSARHERSEPLVFAASPRSAAGPNPARSRACAGRGFPGGLVQVGQEHIRGALLGHNARFGVAPPPARSKVVVLAARKHGGQRSTTGAVAWPTRACHRPGIHQQHQRPARQLGLPVTRRLTQARQPAPGRLGHEIQAVHLGRVILAAACRNLANGFSSASWRLIVVRDLPAALNAAITRLMPRGRLLSPCESALLIAVNRQGDSSPRYAAGTSTRGSASSGNATAGRITPPSA